MKFINLKQFRKEYQLSQKQLVERIELPQSTVSYLENGLQEFSSLHEEILKKRFPDVDFTPYIFERNGYASSTIEQIASKRDFEGDWNSITPEATIGGIDILLIVRRIALSVNGILLLDKNNGSFSDIGYYIIQPSQLSNPHLLRELTLKEWFDNGIFEDFKRFYKIACGLAGIIPVSQEK